MNQTPMSVLKTAKEKGRMTKPLKIGQNKAKNEVETVTAGQRIWRTKHDFAKALYKRCFSLAQAD